MIDPRTFSDRQLLAYLAFGNLPRRGWAGRRRLLVIRGLLLLVIALAVLVGLALVRIAIIVLWAASL